MMSVKPPRAYHSPQRDEQSNATRRAILVAAEQVFAERGYAVVTMSQIARQADVAVATVYLYFPGKAAIVAALADALSASPDLSVEHVEREPDPIRQLQIGARMIRQLNERSWLVADIVRSAHGKDENLAEIWATWQQRHLDAVRRGIEALHERGALRAGLELDAAIDTFYALLGTDVYRALVRERAWSPQQYEEWLFRLACRELLDAPPG
jgi:AcrR family transcriptional regulator